MTAPTLGVDIGGTKLAAGLVGADGTRSDLRRHPTPVTTDPEVLWAALVDLLDGVCAGAAPRAVGVGCGGPMRWPEGAVSPINIPAWRGFPLRARLVERFPGVDVVVHNDAVAMALGEQRFGAGRGRSAFLGVVVSTGVGGGLVRAGRPVDGRTGNAGHVGHVVVDTGGPPCGCGGHGCLEAVARGPALVAWALEHGWVPPTGEPDGRALVTSAAAGDAVATSALRRGGRALGVALASVAAVEDLDGIAVGGGLANAGDLLLAPARAAYAEHARLSFTAGCGIEVAALGSAGGVVGAAALVMPPPGTGRPAAGGADLAT